MTGIPDNNRQAFDSVAEALCLSGHEAVNPFDLAPVRRADESEEEHYERCMEADINALTNGCDAILLLPGWENSHGAKRELKEALDIGLAVRLL